MKRQLVILTFSKRWGPNTPWQRGRGWGAVGGECVLHRKAWKLIKRFGGKQTGTRTFIVAFPGRNRQTKVNRLRIS